MNVGKIAMVANENNEIINVNNNWIYPFYYMEVGDVFLYNYAPFIRIGAKNIRGVFVEFEVNAVSLINGRAIHLDNDDLVILIENPWKNYNTPSLPKGYYKDK